MRVEGSIRGPPRASLGWVNKRMALTSRHKLSILSFNSYFREEAKRARQLLGIPHGGFDQPTGAVWREAQFSDWARRIYRTHGYPIEPFGEDDSPYEGFMLKNDLRETLSWTEQNKWDEAIRQRIRLCPLRVISRRLLQSFDLPYSHGLLESVEWYVLTGDHEHLAQWSNARVPWLGDPRHYGTDYVTVPVGLDSETTKEQWADLWPEVRRIVDSLVGHKKITGRPPRAPSGRDGYWWRMLNEEGFFERVAEAVNEFEPSAADLIAARKDYTLENIAYLWELLTPGDEFGPDYVRRRISVVDTAMQPQHPL